MCFEFIRQLDVHGAVLAAVRQTTEYPAHASRLFEHLLDRDDQPLELVAFRLEALLPGRG